MKMMQWMKWVNMDYNDEFAKSMELLKTVEFAKYVEIGGAFEMCGIDEIL